MDKSVKSVAVTTYTKKELEKFNATNLIKIAKEELGITLEEGLTKGQKIGAILKAQDQARGVADIVTADDEVKAIIKPVPSGLKAKAVELLEMKAGDTFVYASNRNQPYKVDSVVQDEKYPLKAAVTITNTVTGKVWVCTKPRDLKEFKVIHTKDLAEVKPKETKAVEKAVEVVGEKAINAEKKTESKSSKK